MLVIRYRRIGKKNKPSYRVVVAEHTFPLDGKFTADLGSYNPHTKATTLNKEEVLSWMKKGAKPSNSVAKLLQSEKVKHPSVIIIKRKKKTKKAAEETVAAPTPIPAEAAAPEPEAAKTDDQPTDAPVSEAAEEPDSGSNEAGN